MKSKCIRTIAICAILATLLCIPVIMTACDDRTGTGPENNMTYVAIDINPSVELVVDSSGNVTAVIAANRDAEVMLYNSSGIVNQPLETAVRMIALLAEKYGYVKSDAKIGVTVAGKNSNEENSVADKVSSVLTSALSSFNVTVQQASDALLEAEADYLKEVNAGKPGYDTLTASKLRLIHTAMMYDPSLNMDVAVTLANEQLIQRIEARKDDIKQSVSTAFRAVKEEAEFYYNIAKQWVSDSAYALVINDIPFVPDFGYASAKAERSLLARYLDKLSLYEADPVIKEDMFRDEAALEEMLGGIGVNVTADDVKVLVNIAREQSGVKVSTLRTFVSAVCRRNGDDITIDYDVFVDRFLQSDVIVQGSVSLTDMWANAEKILAAFPDIDADINVTVDGGREQIAARIAELDAKIAEYEKKIAVLSEEDKATVAEFKDGFEAALSIVKKNVEGAIQAAKDEASAWLSQAQQNRLSIV